MDNPLDNILKDKVRAFAILLIGLGVLTAWGAPWLSAIYETFIVLGALLLALGIFRDKRNARR